MAGRLEVAKDYEKHVPTVSLRFLEKEDGKRTLQQLIEVRVYSADHVPKKGRTEWQDVPMVSEKKEEAAVGAA